MKNTYAHYCYWILSLLFSFQWEPDLCVKSIDISLDSNFTYKSNFWFVFFILFVEIQICYSFTGAWRVPCFISNEIYRMKYIEWNPIDSQSIQKKWLFFAQFHDIFLVHFKAYAILMLIWSITRRMSARFESILQVSTSTLFMFNWLDGVKCRIFQLQCIFNNRANPSHRVLSIDLQFVKSDNIFVLFVARLHFSINQMMCWF